MKTSIILVGIVATAGVLLAYEHGDLPSLPSAAHKGVECTTATTTKRYATGAPVITDGGGPLSETTTFEFLPGDNFKVFVAGQEFTGPMTTTATTYTTGKAVDWTSDDGKSHHVGSGTVINRSTGEAYASDDWTWRYPDGDQQSANSVTTGKCHTITVAPKM
jgi:hypothetical protein